ncbi:MAG: MATE family efflux transporter [Rhizobiales bacterium]|nr:MATE family efflux transporter [Hyphomicrobiales bacterium]
MSAASSQAVFLSGSIMRHVVVMTLTGAVGLMTMFGADLADLFYLSLLKDTNVTAAIGFAGILSFANLSMGIGIGIATAALVARNLGAGNPERAREFATSCVTFTLVVSGTYTIIAAIFAEPLMRVLGAEGEALRLAVSYIHILTPGFIMLATAVCCSFALRGIGSPNRAMFVTLGSAVATLIMDPIMIFHLGWGIQGAAVAHVTANACALAFGLHGIAIHHRFLNHLSLSGLRRDFRAIWAIAFPAILTQLATPFTIAYTTYAMAPYGTEAVSSSAIIGRIVPVAFGIIFSLSGAVGPIIGQNFGARDFGRVKQTLKDGLSFAAAYTLLTSLLLFLFRHPLADAFHLTGEARHYVLFFCTWIGITWAFAGAQFVANAAFNNLGRPTLSTWFNWGKATLGTIPFAMVGSALGGVTGMMAAIGAGSIAFGIASVWVAARIVNRLETGTA